MAFVRLSEGFYKLVRVQESPSGDYRASMIDEPKNVFPVDAESIQILDSALLDNHFDEESRHVSNLASPRDNVPSESSIVFARFGTEAVFAFGVVIGRDVQHGDIVVQFQNGPVFMVNRVDCFQDPVLLSKLKILTPISDERHLAIPKSSLRTLLISAIWEIAAGLLFLGLWAYGFRLSGSRIESDTTWRNNFCFLGTFFNLIASAKSLHLLNRLRINYRETMLWQFTIRSIQIICFDGYAMAGSRGIMILLAGIQWLERLFMITWFVRAGLRVDHNCRLECVSNDETEDVESSKPHSSHSRTRASGRSFSSRASSSISQNSFLLKANPIRIPTESHLIMERTTVHCKYFSCMMIALITILLVPVLCFETYRLMSDENPFFNEDQLSAINRDMRGLNFSFAENSVIEEGVGIRIVATNTRVVMVLLDGFRYDSLSRNEEFKSLMTEIEYDSVAIPMITQIPTMSVPNWMTLITGAPPMITGVLGNLDSGSTAFENIFSYCSDWGLVSGVTGSDWFSQLIQVYVSDGAASTEENLSKASYFGSASSNPVLADRQRFESLNTAIMGHPTRFDFFLAHLSSLDNYGHLYGVENDPLDRYWSTVSTFALQIRRSIANLPDDSILMIVSDHGHVDRGGHGGISDDILNVPLIVYKKYSGLSRLTATLGKTKLPSIDVAPTISSLLGIPPPSTSFGTPIFPLLEHLISSSDDVRSLERIWRQQQSVLERHFLNRIDPAWSLNSESWRVRGSGSDRPFNFITSIYDEAKDSNVISTAFFSRCLTNLTINTFLSTLYFLSSFIVLFELGRHVTPIRMSISEILVRRLRPIRSVLRQELLCIVGSILYLLVYVTSMAFLFFIVWYSYGYGYHTIESTLIHHPSMMLPMFMSILIPSVSIQSILNRSFMYVIQYSLGVFKRNQESVKENKDQGEHGIVYRWLMTLLCLYHPARMSNPYVDGSSLKQDTILFHRKKHVSRLIMSKLLIYSFLIFSLTVFIALSNFLPRFTGIFTWVRMTGGQLSIPTVLKSGWNFRFRLLLMLWMVLPAFIGQMIVIAVSLSQLMYTAVFFKSV